MRYQEPTTPPPPVICTTEEEKLQQNTKILKHCGAMPSVTTLLVGAFNVQVTSLQFTTVAVTENDPQVSQVSKWS